VLSNTSAITKGGDGGGIFNDGRTTLRVDGGSIAGN